MSITINGQTIAPTSGQSLTPRAVAKLLGTPTKSIEAVGGQIAREISAVTGQQISLDQPIPPAAVYAGTINIHAYDKLSARPDAGREALRCGIAPKGRVVGQSQPCVFEAREFDARVAVQMHRMYLSWTYRDQPHAKVNLNKKVPDTEHREGRCYNFSQEAVIALANYYGIKSAIVRLTRPSADDPTQPETHHLVLTSDGKVVDLTAEQFVDGKGKRLSNQYMAQYDDAIAQLAAIGFKPEHVYTEAEFLVQNWDVGPNMNPQRRRFGMPEYRMGSYADGLTLPTRH